MSFVDRLLARLGLSRVRLRMLRRRAAGFRLVPDDFPLVTVVLLGLCGLFYMLALKLTSNLTGESGFTPARAALVRYGATYTPFIREGEWWRTVTSVFLHANLIHILMNGLGLWVVGVVTEDVFGRARTLVVFVATGTIGMVASVWWHPIVLGVGASGAIFGLMGAVVAFAARHRRHASARRLRQRFAPWLLYALLFGFVIPGVDNAAHLGGLASGALIGLFLADRGTARRVRWAWEVAAGAAVLLVALSFYLAAHSALAS